MSHVYSPTGSNHILFDSHMLTTFYPTRSRGKLGLASNETLTRGDSCKPMFFEVYVGPTQGCSVTGPRHACSVTPGDPDPACAKSARAELPLNFKTNWLIWANLPKFACHFFSGSCKCTTQSCTSKGVGRQGIGSCCKQFLCCNTTPCRPMP